MNNAILRQMHRINRCVCPTSPKRVNQQHNATLDCTIHYSAETASWPGRFAREALGFQRHNLEGFFLECLFLSLYIWVDIQLGPFPPLSTAELCQWIYRTFMERMAISYRFSAHKGQLSKYFFFFHVTCLHNITRLKYRGYYSQLLEFQHHS